MNSRSNLSARCRRESFASAVGPAAARLSVFKHLETFYNRVRLHLALGCPSPNSCEADAAPAAAAETPAPPRSDSPGLSKIEASIV